ncbi:Uncharacterized protein FWK35_00007916 [Aphis craccivora]|uniref:Uncharacterized protein n=1 Tax=Aphis craccivora TaxID=307492 RepID=A0A6G0ZLP8_APHCR|nr:Uncharacterized protein FWK35_00007916 [Aphis craccivora]
MIFSRKEFYFINGIKYDLSITLTSTPNFHLHIEAVCCRVLKVVGLVKHVISKFHLTAPLKESVQKLFDDAPSLLSSLYMVP